MVESAVAGEPGHGPFDDPPLAVPPFERWSPHQSAGRAPPFSSRERAEQECAYHNHDPEDSKKFDLPPSGILGQSSSWHWYPPTLFNKKVGESRTQDTENYDDDEDCEKC